MDATTAKNLLLAKVKPNNKINKHFTSESWRNKNGVELLYQYLQQKVPELPLAVQIDIAINYDSIVPKCQRCGGDVNIFKPGRYFCNACAKIDANEKRKLTNISKYGGPAPLSNREKLEQSRNTRIAKYGSANYNNQQKREQTCIEKYGVSHHMLDSSIKQKVVDTHAAKYGAMYANTPEGRTKATSTSLEKYGAEHWMQNEDVKSKLVETNQQKYGVDNPFLLPEIQQKCRDTNTIKYGHPVARSSTTVGEKISQTCLERYGSTSPLGAKQVRSKIAETNQQKYGTVYPISTDQIQEKRIASFSLNHDRKIISSLSDHQKQLLEDIPALYDRNVNEQLSISYLAEVCGVPPSFLRRRFEQAGYQPVCYRNFSTGQKNLADLIESVLGVKCILDDRTSIYPREIDILLPEHNVGIEYHGSYWHSSASEQVDRSHYIKHDMAAAVGIDLIQVFDHEVDRNSDLIVSMIASKVGKISNKIYARKCTVELLNVSQYRKFCEENHIQGYAAASIKLGLIFEGQLVSVMSFGKSRYSQTHQYEMVRFCNKKWTTVVGGAGKLFKYFTTNNLVASVVTYADARFFTGNLYQKLGFALSHRSPPNYWYVSSKYDGLQSRVKYQKHKLKELLPIFDPTKSEKANMIENGYKIVNDCGNYVYVWESPTSEFV